MPMEDPPAGQRPDPSGSAGPDPTVTETDVPTATDADSGTDADAHTDTHTDADADAASGPDASPEAEAQVEVVPPTEQAEPSHADSPGGSDDRRLAPPGPIRHYAQADEARPRHLVGRPARLTPIKATPVKATPPRTTPIKAPPVVATPIKPFPVKARGADAASVSLGRGHVPQTRPSSGRGRTSDAATAPGPTSESTGEATPPADVPATADAPAPIGPAPASFARGTASIAWHPPMADSPPAAAVSPAPLGFIAPGNMFSPPRHAAARPGRRTALLVTTSALAVLFALVSAGFAVAFVNRSNAYHKQVTTVNQREATIASNVSQINDLKSKLAAAQARAQQLQTQIADSASQVSELQQEKTALGQCITSINNFFTVVGDNGTSAEQSTAQTAMETDCNAAQKYLN